MKFLRIGGLLLCLLTLSVVLASANSFDVLVGKWSGTSNDVPDRTPRELTITKVHDDGRIECTFWGPSLGSYPALTCSDTSHATMGKKGRISVFVAVKDVLDLELEYAGGTMSGIMVPKTGMGMTRRPQFTFSR